MKRFKRLCINISVVIFFVEFSFNCRGATILVEAETFSCRGGWVVDQQAMDQMGSPCLLAHGLGVPVNDAVTEVEIPRTDSYRIFVRTMDWVARWKAPGAPGKFKVLINGTSLDETFGTKGVQWFWHYGGTAALKTQIRSTPIISSTGQPILQASANPDGSWVMLFCRRRISSAAKTILMDACQQDG